MADDLAQEYLKHRVTAERENSPLADFLRQNADKFVESPRPEPIPTRTSSQETSETPQQESPERGKLQKGIDWAAFMVRPLGALQEAAIAPIAKTDYQADSFLGQLAEPFSVSFRAFKDALFPSAPGSRPDYEAQVVDKYAPDLPEALKPTAEMVTALASDPAILAFPFMKSLQAGLRVSAAESGGPGQGPFRRALEEAVSFGPTRDEDAARLQDLATRADGGDLKAAQELVTDQVASSQLSATLGRTDAPLVSLVDEKVVQNFLDLPRAERSSRAVNINLSRINSPDDVKSLLNDTAKIFREDIDAARRGVQSNKETARLAESLGMSVEELLLRRRGEAFNAETAYAARQLLVSSAEKLQGLARKILEPNAGSLDKIAFRKQLSLHKAIQDQVSGLTAEAGRALQQFNIPAGSTKAALQQIDDVMGQLNMYGGMTEDIARGLVDMRTPQQINEYARNIEKVTSKDVFFEVWINSLLSGPQTHAVNSISNSMVALWQIPERVLASGFSKILNTDGGVASTEALGQAYGLVHGFRDGLKSFARVVRTEQADDLVDKLERPINAAISAESLNISGKAGRAVDYIGRAVRMPGTLLSAEDAFFKSIGYRMELHARAFRQATEEGLKGVAAAERVQQILKNPPEDIHLAAIDAARYQTFTKPLGPAGQGYQRIVANLPALKIITPFIRTPTNIFKFFGERSVFAPLAKSWRADIKAGGARRDLALARTAMGSAVMATAATYAAEGRITGGGPVDSNLRAMKYNTGWQPYSVRVDDKYVSYQRLEPLGTLLGVAADFAEISGELDELEAQETAAHLSMAVAKNVTNKTFLRGIAEAVNALEDPVRYGDKWWLSLAQTAVPTGVAQIARIQDPYLREARSTLDRIKSRIPGYSDEVPVRRNIWGEPIVLEGGLGPDILSPFYTSDVKEDPVSEEILRLGLPIEMPGRDIQGVELTPEQYDRLVVLTAKPPNEVSMKGAIEDVMSDPEYKGLPEEAKRDTVRGIVRAYKQIGRALLLQEYGEDLTVKIEKLRRELYQ